MQTVKIGMLGCGTVGSGVVKLLQEKSQEYARRCGAKLELSKILVRDLNRVREGVDPALLTEDPAEILEDEEIQIIVEVMGGVDPTREYLLQAIGSGKHIVTANKALIAQHGDALFDAASENEVSLYIEAAVAGGLPIIQTIKRSLVANKLLSMYGIINGTTNYILSAMTEEGREFQEVLSEAQAKGYAEADPTDDVEGFDAVYKLAILSSLVFEQRMPLKQIHRVGITRIASRDIEYAKQFGYVIKLLAIAKQEDGHFQARVNPTMIPADHPLASVNGVFNAILLKGDAAGDIMFYGQGAGSLPTASAVVSDILNIVTDLDNPPNMLMACQHGGEHVELSQLETVVNRYYVRILTADKSGVLGQIGTLLGKEDISVHTLLQRKEEEGDAELVFITHPVSDQKLRQAIAQIRQLETTREIYSIIRVEDFSV
ncbi:homoserine dehydrogenase [bacterium (Candidatus Blackallbacteria) CG17_big_fil_post_rev_8_21_14_2_50_48_46]|uniref:Homoserine dehydrogenase n=1 Tax=bacterium (Candidatus Blackallbacteria) CG17_big_fil_post_rev_8_21_14_2_50_48_46 TaxID=2014261 RepID=A0A2M7G6K2_9BACT|nr:MAG: homoserine dehydrogenase [bacterium (Candidatus Blackallbacteria) CG18_big_fil_WC_8_21_14_2_50_49_26]PIW17671.1 MAG: homoserine dehydrogenase [bacterium (Candidatus Blackallbacteria) CG17_big_fil_post_rev_8_21_14_2_50_48_46]PIW50110.1 MAG: homoserine dehydrogenase [bacterium (Candidatus Blackallbacteria) CG13_big_fil_rev_8_21_14_2_50_49_14]